MAKSLEVLFVEIVIGVINMSENDKIQKADWEEIEHIANAYDINSRQREVELARAVLELKSKLNYQP